MQKLILWFWLTVLIFVVFVVIPYISLFFEPKITAFFAEYVSLIDIRFKSEYKVLWLIFYGANLLIYCTALIDVSSIYNYVNRRLLVFRTTYGQHTTNLETEKLRKKIGWESVWYVFFKSYIPKLFAWLGLCNLLLIGVIHNDWKKAILVAVGFGIAGWASSQQRTKI